MLSKAQIKHIRSLTQQKYRKEHRELIVEGDKMVREWLQSEAEVRMIVSTEAWAGANDRLTARHPDASLFIVSDSMLESVSALQTPNQVLLVAALHEETSKLPVREWCIAADCIQDPGNLGTIIRIADWFGIQHIIASSDSADFYNPKVVQAAMGGHLRVKLHKTALASWLDAVEVPVLAATLHGDNLYTMNPLEAAVLIIGNESKGVDPVLIGKATKGITIPKRGEAESLNAAVSAGIICSHLVR